MQNSFVSFKEKKEGVVIPGLDRTTDKVEPWSFNSFSASEGMRSSAEDLIKYLKAFSQSSSSELDLILPNIIKTYEPSFTEKLFYGQGWHVMKINKRLRALISNGNTSGHSAFIASIPETKTGVVILSNSSYGTHDLGLLILRMINYNWKRKPQ
jgi:CubicO group peptidase (beta-lactamase class C family)